MTGNVQPIYYRRRSTHKVCVGVGGTAIGGKSPILVQSMTDTPTLDVEASTAQVLRLVRAGAGLVRLTAQTAHHAYALGDIRQHLDAVGCHVPLCADIHFNPNAAFEAAKHVEKVRINPGNFADPGRTFVKLEYTDEEYAAEQERIAERLRPLLALCRERKVALRLGVNHGSLSDRIMSRYGDTPEGMAESAMEYLRICRAANFEDVVVSIKASNVVVMTHTVRLLVAAMEAEGMDFPLHLGVTEAGDGEDARVKSAAGIGSLLTDGIGDTIRVSLSEPPECEIPVAYTLLAHTDAVARRNAAMPMNKLSYDFGACGLEPISGDIYVHGVDDPKTAPSTVLSACDAIEWRRRLAEYLDKGNREPVMARLTYSMSLRGTALVLAVAADLGALLLNPLPLLAGIQVTAPGASDAELSRLLLSVMQACRRRITRTEYIACPGCGRTLFDLRDTLENVRRATSHLTGLKIAVMGCVVNGPGEMADADYGYVGAAAGHVSLYRRRECVRRNIPQADAVQALIQLIKDCGDWKDPNEENA